MFRYRLQFLSRKQGDYARHLKAARLALTAGRIECRSYGSGDTENLAVLVENEDDIEAVLAALPADAFVGAQNLTEPVTLGGQRARGWRRG